MNTTVHVNTYSYSVTYVANKLLLSLQAIIRMSGLSPEKLTNDWEVLERGIRKWLETQDLLQLVLEVFNPWTNALIGRWDLEVSYGFVGDGTFWVNTEDIRYHIQKAGSWPSTCNYRVIATTKPYRPDVPGWSITSLRSTDGFIKQSIGTTIDGSGLSIGTGYWRRR
jgi:hypothetical protein